MSKTSNKNQLEGIVGIVFYECKHEGCDKTFSSKKALNEHKRTHKDRRDFTCSICDQKFTQFSSLQKHQRVHDKKKPFKCDFKGCSSAFTQVSNLIRHKRIHTGEKPYKCDKCGKGFASGSNLKQHKTTHRSFKSRNAFKCKFCNKTNYLYQTSLRKHMQQCHKEEFRKLVDELEVDKSSVIHTKQGKVFLIELIDKDNKISHKLELVRKRKAQEELANLNKIKKEPLYRKPSRNLKSPQALYGSFSKKFPISSATKDAKLNGIENSSFIKQSSQLSEASQYGHANMADFADNKFFNCETAKDPIKPIKPDSFLMGGGSRMFGKNSSFNSHGMFSKNGSFLNPYDLKYFEDDKNGKGLIHINSGYFKGDDVKLSSFKLGCDKSSPVLHPEISRLAASNNNNFGIKEYKESPHNYEENHSFFKSGSFKVANKK